VKRLATMLAVLACTMPTASVAEDWSGDLLCTGKFAGGLAHDQATDEWYGSKFEAGTKYEVSFRKVPDSKMSYLALLNRDGEGWRKCMGESTDYSFLIVDPIPYAECLTGFHYLKLNVSTLRFFVFFIHGYTNDGPTYENTPVVEGGTCAWIQRGTSP
jgi:hypothetical protein